MKLICDHETYQLTMTINLVLTLSVPRSLSTSVPASAQAAVSHHSKWSYVAGPGYPPLMGLTIGQVMQTF